MVNPFLEGTTLPIFFFGWAWLAAAAPAIIAGVSSLWGGERANEASAKEASLNREFQERLSRTAHQREVADLRAAGLNPILSGTGGRGASTPSGSMAVQRDVVTPAVGSALAANRQRQEIKNMKAQEAQTKQVILNEKQQNRILKENVGTAAWNRTRAYHESRQSMNLDLQTLYDVTERAHAHEGNKHMGDVHSSAKANKIREAELLGRGYDVIGDRVGKLLPWGGHGRKGGKAMNRAKDKVRRQLGR